MESSTRPSAIKKAEIIYIDIKKIQTKNIEDNYFKMKKIGKGGFGEVHLVKDR